ncbi:uncharacterized protein LOC122070492 [Macadamia integrifolia]|uniref:uncharacterized protein LOC122070492 n=1 Tax=Macadamia integrifolia TaxID=60698 RepID=UPI001C4E675C|nr:uncharacterized protein LOC122070492 [Macadamia integrifolia]
MAIPISVPILTGSNFLDWHEELIYYLTADNHDYCLCNKKPADLIDKSIIDEISLHEKWTRSNQLSLLFIKKTIRKFIKGSIPDSTDAKTYLASIEKWFSTLDKSLTDTLMAKLVNMKYNDSSAIADHIYGMTNLSAQLAKMDQILNEPFLVGLIIQSLPQKFKPFKIHYNTNKDKWDLNELQSKCVQEEQRLKQAGGQMANMVSHKCKKGKNFKVAPKKQTSNPPTDNKNSGKVKCFFCKKEGHLRKDYQKHRAWFKKKGNNSILVCFQINLVDVPCNTWRIDSGATVHIKNSIQGFLST